MVAVSLVIMGSVWYPLFEAAVSQDLPDNTEYHNPKRLEGIGPLKLGHRIPPDIEKIQIELSEYKGAHSLDYIPEKHPTAEFFVIKDEARQCLVATKSNLIGAVECEPRALSKQVDLIERWKQIYPSGEIETSPRVGNRTFSYTDKKQHKIVFETFRDFLETTKESIELEKANGLINEYKILVVIDHGENRWTERMTDLSILPPWTDSYRQAMIATMHSTEKMIDSYLTESGTIDQWLMEKGWYMKFLIHQKRIPQHLLNP